MYVLNTLIAFTTYTSLTTPPVIAISPGEDSVVGRNRDGMSVCRDGPNHFSLKQVMGGDIDQKQQDKSNHFASNHTKQNTENPLNTSVHL